MPIKRTINIDVTVKIVCCRDGVEAYTPLPQDFHKTLAVTKDYFDESLTIWRDRIVQKYEDYLFDKATDECLLVGTRRLCKFDADWTRTTVTQSVPGIGTPPKKKPSKDVIEKRKRLQREIRRRRTQLEKLEAELQKLEKEYED